MLAYPSFGIACVHIFPSSIIGSYYIQVRLKIDCQTLCNVSKNKTISKQNI